MFTNTNFFFIFEQLKIFKPNTKFMIFENKLTTGKFKIAYIGILGIVASLGAYVLFESMSVTSKDIIIGIISLLVCTYIFMLLLKPDYIFLSDKDGKLTVRYYSSHPFFRKYKAFEIPKRIIAKYNIEKSFFGLKKDLYFTAKTPKGIVTYPPVSISGLTGSERQILEKFLIALDNDLKMYK